MSNRDEHVAMVADCVQRESKLSDWESPSSTPSRDPERERVVDHPGNGLRELFARRGTSGHPAQAVASSPTPSLGNQTESDSAAAQRAAIARLRAALRRIADEDPGGFFGNIALDALEQQ